MTQRLKNLTAKNLNFHENMSQIKKNNEVIGDMEDVKQKLLLHPFVNKQCAFYNNPELIEQGFVEVDFDINKIPFDFEDEEVTFIEVRSNFNPNQN